MALRGLSLNAGEKSSGRVIAIYPSDWSSLRWSSLSSSMRLGITSTSEVVSRSRAQLHCTSWHRLIGLLEHHTMRDVIAASRSG